MQIRNLKPQEWSDGMALAWRTFLKFESAEYDPEGVRSFYRFVIDEDLEKMFLIGEYKAIGAFDGDEIVGIIGLRNSNFLSILFVDERYHRRGIATALVQTLADYVRSQGRKTRLLVFSSPYAVGFYHKIGFTDMGPVQKDHGMIYTPMEFKL